MHFHVFIPSSSCLTVQPKLSVRKMVKKKGRTIYPTNRTSRRLGVSLLISINIRYFHLIPLFIIFSIIPTSRTVVPFTAHSLPP
ncbi:hypothetical protein EDD21DRAFT_442185 [Dissophora ornata]|nr:hypothetical protein EDD21DRAFT_442185 [Dissophora ornata]